MTNVVSFRDAIGRVEAEAVGQHSTLSSGSGNGTNGGMEARVAALEAHMEHVRSDVSALQKDTSEVKVNLATLTERVAHLPSKGFVVTTTTVALAVIAALFAFQHTIQVWTHQIPGP